MNKIAAIFAFLVGAMSIVAGGKVLQGWEPGWLVLNWLPFYNFVMGMLSIIPAILIWKNSRHAMTSALAVFGMHALVLLLLLTVFRSTTAAQSVLAMSFRLSTWLVILGLTFFHLKKKGSTVFNGNC
jgi:hypothetical protein